MGTSWISRKGGILEKGRGVDLEKGGYDPPYQLCTHTHTYTHGHIDWMFLVVTRVWLWPLIRIENLTISPSVL